LIALVAGLSACSYFDEPQLEVTSDDLDMSEAAATYTPQEVDISEVVSRSTDGRVTLYSLDQAYDPVSGQTRDLSDEEMEFIAPVQAHPVPGSMMPEEAYRMRNNNSVYLYPLP